MTLEFNCISCGEEFRIEKEEGGIIIVVWKNGAKFYACSMECAAEARDNDEKGPKPEKGFPFRGLGSRPGKGKGRDKNGQPPGLMKKARENR